MGKGTLISGFLSIPKHDFQSIPRYGGGKSSQLLAHIQLHELGDGVIALERAGVRALSSTVRKPFRPAGRRCLAMMGAESWNDWTRAAPCPFIVFESREILGGDGIGRGRRGDSIT